MNSNLIGEEDSTQPAKERTTRPITQDETILCERINDILEEVDELTEEELNKLAGILTQLYYVTNDSFLVDSYVGRIKAYSPGFRYRAPGDPIGP